MAISTSAGTSYTKSSGLNIVVSDVDRPLIIKVASISSARMQVYFIDNDDYFHRKAVFTDPESGEFFKDNDERAIFFARGILETVKKLRWKPDLIHCQGWISNLLPIYLKKAYKEDPIFAESKVVLSLYEEFSPKMKSKVILPGIRSRDLDLLNTPNGINLAKLAVQYSDGIILGSPSFNPELEKYLAGVKIPTLPYIEVT